MFNVPTKTQDEVVSSLLSTCRWANLNTFSLTHSLGLLQILPILIHIIMKFTKKEFICKLKTFSYNNTYN